MRSCASCGAPLEGEALVVALGYGPAQCYPCVWPGATVTLPAAFHQEQDIGWLDEILKDLSDW